MRKKNGTTIVEMLVSLIIISIIIALLFNMLIQVRQEDVSNEIQTQFITNQSTFIKQLQEDMIDFGVKRISNCSLSEANISTVYANTPGKFTCIRIIYNDLPVSDSNLSNYEALRTNNIGFLMIYKEYTRFETYTKGVPGSEKWNIQYVRGRYTKVNNKDSLRRAKTDSWKNYTKTMYSYPDEVIFTDVPYLKYSNYDPAVPNVKSSISTLVIPIVNADGEHYDITTEFASTSTTGLQCDPSVAGGSMDKSLFSCKQCNAANNYCG